MIKDAREGLKTYFDLYNTERIHQALGYRTPWEVYSGMESPVVVKTGGCQDMGNLEKIQYNANVGKIFNGNP